MVITLIKKGYDWEPKYSGLDGFKRLNNSNWFSDKKTCLNINRIYEI